jgi:putative salt-induced outer membrane protein YdiY
LRGECASHDKNSEIAVAILSNLRHPGSMRLPIFAALLLLPSIAAAQGALPKGTAKDESVTKGKTDVTSDSYETIAKREEKAKDATELAISGGGLFASGNSSLLALTGGFGYRLRRGENQFSLIGVGNYSRSAVGGATPNATVENLQGRSRYDRFVSERVSLFLGWQARRDRFAGLDLRMQIDPGVGYYFINLKERQFWGELGYDFLYDIRREDARDIKDKTGNIIGREDRTKTVHSGRAFLGYRYKINEGVSIASGLEFLQGISDTAIRRINGDIVVSSKFTASFSLATSFLVRYDSKPLPGKQNLDTITAISLVYNLI